MSKVILEFDPIEEAHDLYCAQHGARFRFALQSIDNYLRSLEKYKDVKKISVDEVRKMIYDKCDDWNVDLFD